MIALKLYNGDPDNADLTLRDLYETHLLEELDSPSVGTLSEYQTVINDWERLMQNSAVRHLSRKTVKNFQRHLANELIRGNPRSPATINKKLRTLGPLIRLAWPKDSHNPGGLGLCEYFKLPKPLTEENKVPFVYSGKQMNALYKAAAEMDWPRRFPATTWRTIFVMHYTCGPRTFDLLSLKWSNVDFEYGRGRGAISFIAAKTGKRQRIPLKNVARRHLLKLREHSRTDYLFPGFQKSNHRHLYANWKKLLTLAGLPTTCHLEDFRKTCNTAYEERFPGVGEWILGHSLSRVNAKNYVNPTRMVLRAIRKLPVPTEFKQGA
ncbi:Phage integrase family protein [Rubinisphaera italica]|uniref:Phage integrase family protein n=2 Tax=Rubinisphaera italica TaxID=2527969 RepID=A0A5C5XKD1_9PLAN|nr:Phage integrase family protein [Rubinisphaera italica]